MGGRKGQRIDFSLPPDATVVLPSGEQAPAGGLLEWEVPRERPDDWPAEAAEQHERFWQARLERQQAIDESIAAKADFEYLYDKPYEDKHKVRVAGPFTVESISPHRYVGLDADDNFIDPTAGARREADTPQDFVSIILDNLCTAGVQQAHKADCISFVSLQPWPGDYICAQGTYVEGLPGSEAGAAQDAPSRAAVFVGPEFGTVTRTDLAAASREAADAGFDVLIACAFNYDAHASELNKLGARNAFGNSSRDPHTFGHILPLQLGVLLKELGKRVDADPC